jgi:SIR2-like protein
MLSSKSPTEFLRLTKGFIETSLKSGVFIPFLGVGASIQHLVGEDTPHEHWFALAHQLDLLEKSFPSPSDALSPEAAYVRSVAQANGVQIPPLDKVPVPNQLPTALKEDSSEQVRLFQVAVASLGSVLAELTGRHLSENRDCLSPIATFRVSLKGMTSAEWSRLAASFSEAILRLIPLLIADSPLLKLDKDESRVADDGAPPMLPPLYAHAIFVKLLGLCLLVLGKDRYGAVATTLGAPGHGIPLDTIAEVRGHPRIVERMVEDLPEERDRFTGQSPGIALYELEWVSNLLWYSLRYRLPLYPTSQELGFQLSLSSSSPPGPPTGPLNQAAGLVGYDELVSAIRRFFRFYDSGYPMCPLFHRQLALALRYCFSTYVERRERIDEESLRRGQTENWIAPNRSRSAHSQTPAALRAASRGSTILPPVAFTTNLDRALEKAFEQLEQSYHVVYPVLPRFAQTESGDSKSGNQDVKVAWLLRTVNCGTSRDDPTPPYVPKQLVVLDPQQASFPNPEKLLGPVIVKLHGSPLDPTDAAAGKRALSIVNPDGSRADFDSSEPFLVLSERFYLEALLQRERNKPPLWIERHLSIPAGEGSGSIWFLGYSMSDWNVRVQMYDQVRHSKSHQSVRAAEKYAVVSVVDEFQSAVLADLKVKFFHNTLDEFTTLLGAALNSLGAANG